jgi:hypothetical protein
MITYQPIPEEQQRRLAAIFRAKGGKSQAARIFKCCRQTIKAAASGQPVHPWMAERLTKMIAERDAAGKSP